MSVFLSYQCCRRARRCRRRRIVLQPLVMSRVKAEFLGVFIAKVGQRLDLLMTPVNQAETFGLSGA